MNPIKAWLLLVLRVVTSSPLLLCWLGVPLETLGIETFLMETGL